MPSRTANTAAGFIVGDDIKYWQEKAVLHIVDVDGKQCKVDVLRQERLKSGNDK